MASLSPPISPPASVEIRSLAIPYLDENQTDKAIFTFYFTITETDTAIPEVEFTLELNKALQIPQLASPVLPPLVYKFNGKSISFSHITPENYYVKGTINMVSIDPPDGQFMNNHLNFMFTIGFGKIGDTEHDLLGVYPLTIIQN